MEEYVISFVSGNGLRNHQDSGRILGSILFMLQNSWYFWMVEEDLRIYFICTATFLAVEEYYDLLYLYCKISDIFGRWRNIVGSILFVLQDSDIFRQWRNIRIYFICTTKFLTFLDGGGVLDLLYMYCKFYYLVIAS